MVSEFSPAIEKLIGKRADDGAVKSFLASYDVRETLKLSPDSDEDSVYVSRPQLGFSLLFKDITVLLEFLIERVEIKPFKVEIRLQFVQFRAIIQRAG